jgi:hypothetical protein
MTVTMMDGTETAFQGKNERTIRDVGLFSLDGRLSSLVTDADLAHCERIRRPRWVYSSINSHLGCSVGRTKVLGFLRF